MEIFIINGSPRKEGNTARLCRSFEKGVTDSGLVKIRWVNLYELDYVGCKSCFACKRLGSKSLGKCAVHDDLCELLPAIYQCDGLVLASPIYFSDITGQMKSFLERLLFPLTTYEAGYKTLTQKRFPVQTIYTMNVTENEATAFHYPELFERVEQFVAHVFTTPKRLVAYNTYQFKDYRQYKVEVFSEKEKSAWRDTQFPQDQQIAYEAGHNIIQHIFSTK